MTQVRVARLSILMVLSCRTLLRAIGHYEIQRPADSFIHRRPSPLAGGTDRRAGRTTAGSAAQRAVRVEGRGRGNNRGIAALGFRIGWHTLSKMQL